MKIGILGAGALGLSAGARLAQAGHQVEVIERETCVGGLAAGFRVGPSSLEKFYHHLFRGDKTILRWIDELGLTDRLLWLAPDTSTIVDGRVWSLDSASDVLTFGPLSPVDRVRLGICLAYLKALPDPRSLERSTAAQWLRRWMGESTYRVVWEPLLRGKFQSYAEE
ncbi:MAG: NAD(P)-binding protein, partial [Chloroflexi bacterium]|nr:NAD(P)-binding protein [Chloroflexota bacterium]